MIKSIVNKASQSLKIAVRSQEIGLVLTSYGVAGTLASFGFEFGRRGLRVAGVLKGAGKPLDAVLGKSLVKTFVRLGPTFIKVGQVLATRPDVVGEPVAEELKILFDRVPPIPFRRIRRILTKELGREKLKKSFRVIEPQPLASASISQTHRATLSDGQKVILKVQKEGVAELVRLDLEILGGLILPIEAVYPSLQLKTMFADFREATLTEIDYRKEAANIDRFRKNYRKLFADPDVHFPAYYPDISTEKVIALEPMHGTQVNRLKKGSTVARKAATMSLAAVLEQIFEHGFFHADPHAGNLFFQEDEGRVGFIDLGLVGQLKPEDKRKFLRVILAVLQKDEKRLASSLYDLGEAGPKSDYAKFESDIQALIDKVRKQGKDNARLDAIVGDLMRVARVNSIIIPNRYIMMLRSCLVIEGLAKSLDPTISIMNVATPIVARGLLRTYNPMEIFRKFW